MDRCTECHVNRGIIPVPYLGSERKSWYRVTEKFDHGRHEKLPGAGECFFCHLAEADGPGLPLGLPEMEACEGCHQKETAYTSPPELCEKCHGPVPAGLLPK